MGWDLQREGEGGAEDALWLCGWRVFLHRARKRERKPARLQQALLCSVQAAASVMASLGNPCKVLATSGLPWTVIFCVQKLGFTSVSYPILFLCVCWFCPFSSSFFGGCLVACSCILSYLIVPSYNLSLCAEGNPPWEHMEYFSVHCWDFFSPPIFSFNF